MPSLRAIAIALCAIAAAALALFPGGAHAGCYRRGGGRRPQRAESELYFNHAPAKRLSIEALPKEFSWASVDGRNYLTPSWNQHIPQYCGSCWAHGTLSMVQDRLKIAKLRSGDLTPDVMLGRQTLLNCAPFHNMSQGCDGGDAIDVFRYMAKFGLPDESCLHYAASDWTAFRSKRMKKCPAAKHCVNCMPKPTKEDPDAFECWPIKRPVLYTLSAYGKLDRADEAGMMSEILARGPIVCGVAAPDSFVFGYRGGVFVDDGADTEIDHDVEVVGWGVDKQSGLKFWHVRNSWGTYWGALGFFRVQRGAGGNGALQIESGDCWYAVPEHGVEDAVANGTLDGSMYGLRKHKEEERTGGGGSFGGSQDESSGDGGGGSGSGSGRLEQAWADWPEAEGDADAPAAAAAAAARGLRPEERAWGWAAAAAAGLRRAVFGGAAEAHEGDARVAAA